MANGVASQDTKDQSWEPTTPFTLLSAELGACVPGYQVGSREGASEAMVSLA